jgi:g-D-glutamyl-meso-diaminopimelate peptidase
MEWRATALRRAGAADWKQFQAMCGLEYASEPEVLAALLPYLYGCQVQHTVQGDTLLKLARRFQTTVKAILAANPQLEPNRLPVGTMVTIPLAFPVVATNVPFSSAWLRVCLRGLKMRYPFLEMEEIARSVSGRPVPVVRIGNGPRVVCWSGAHHANEWITTPLLLRFVEEYAHSIACNGAINGHNARALAQSVTLHVVPMVNPDGVDLVVGEGTDAERRDALRLAANAPQVPFPTGWKANLRGVDLNLQYPARWEQAKAQKAKTGWGGPGPKNYVGSAPLTEPESAALYAYTRRIRPDCILAYHTQGEEIYWQMEGAAAEQARELGEWMEVVSGYRLSSTPPESDAAGYRDWFVQEFQRPGYTIEAGHGESPLPLEQFEEIYNHNIGILTLSLTGGV